MPGHVFISHSDKDKTFAQMLLAALETRGTHCWIAPRDIPPGGSYADAIMRAIEECSCFVLVYTVHSNSSPHVLREVERALKFERNIVPVRFDQCEPSRGLDYLLATVQWLSIDTSAVSATVGHVADQISTCVAPAPATSSSSSAQNVTPERLIPMSRVADKPGLSRSLVVGVVFAILIAAAIFFGQFVSRKLPSQPEPANRPSASQELANQTPIVSLPSMAATAAPIQKAETPALVQAASPELAKQAPIVSLPSIAATAAPIQKVETPPLVQAAGTPQDLLQRYFRCFAERDPFAAYNLLSAGFRSNMSFKKYSAMFSSTREIQLDEVKLLSQGENEAMVFTRFREADANYHQTYWQGPVELVRETDGWRIQTLRNLKSVTAGAVR